jgi:nucleoside-diphosphate-sugar epimerase
VDTNIKGTLNICQAARELSGIRVINTSTSEVYGTAKYVPIDEKHPKQPQSPYSASKIAADAVAMSFYHSFYLPVTTVRPFNTYGPRQSSRAIIPAIITQIASGKKEIKVGDITPTRDFNYVKDTVSGFLKIAECNDTIGMEINIASNQEITIAEILNKIMQIMERDVNFIREEKRIRPPNSEVFRLYGDNSLITSVTEWHPKYNIEQGLKETCEWFLKSENLAKYKSDIYNY